MVDTVLVRPGEIDTRLLRTFLVVVEERYITRAAHRLYLTQQAVSERIRQLERMLGTTLLVRSRRGVVLTPAGAEFATGAREVIRQLDELVDQMRETACAAG